jgi:hypothetical protein
MFVLCVFLPVWCPVFFFFSITHNHVKPYRERSERYGREGGLFTLLACIENDYTKRPNRKVILSLPGLVSRHHLQHARSVKSPPSRSLVVVGDGHGKKRDTTRNHEEKDENQREWKEKRTRLKKMWVGGGAKEKKGKGQKRGLQDLPADPEIPAGIRRRKNQLDPVSSIAQGKRSLSSA